MEATRPFFKNVPGRHSGKYPRTPDDRAFRRLRKRRTFFGFCPTTAIALVFAAAVIFLQKLRNTNIGHVHVAKSPERVVKATFALDLVFFAVGERVAVTFITGFRPFSARGALFEPRFSRDVVSFAHHRGDYSVVPWCLTN